MDRYFATRTFFRLFNQAIMVPIFKMGLGRFVTNPITGQIMVLKMTGRKTGKARYTPLNFGEIDGEIYCFQGRHLKGKWYLNVKSNPDVEVLLPDRRFSGRAEEVTDPHERAMVIREVLRNSGLGGFVYGFDPSAAADPVVQEKTEGIPVIRIVPKSPGPEL
jgi:deazaflavin-dependent oxidoreductase (nitroreductase family)